MPLFGSLIAAARDDRDRPQRRRGGDAHPAAGVGSRGARGDRQIVIFPEGTRSEPGGGGRCRPGILALASRTGLPVIPVATNSGRCWGRRAFRKLPGTIHIAIGEPIPPTADRRDWRRVAARMGVLDGSREIDTA